MKSFTLPLLTLALALSAHAQDISISCGVVGPGGTSSCQPQPTVPVMCIVETNGGTDAPQCTTLSEPPPQAGTTFCVSQNGGTQSCGPVPTETDVGGPFSTSIFTAIDPATGPTSNPLSATNPGTGTGSNTGTNTGPTTGIPKPTGAAERLGANQWVAGGMVVAAILF